MSSEFVATLVFMRRTVRDETSARALINGPQQVAFLRRLEKHAPPQHAALFATVQRLWKEGTLVVDGSERTDPRAELRACLAHLTDVKRDEANPFVHDALHVCAKFLRLVQFVLHNPSRPAGTVSLRFPKSHARLDLLVAAEKFFERTETPAESGLLKRAFAVPGIAEVARRHATFGFQSPTHVHLLTPYETHNVPKDRMTVAALRDRVAAA